MLIQDWDWDTAKSVWQKEAREEGREEGREEAHVETAKRLLREGLPVELVARATLLPVKEVQKLKNTASLVNENTPGYHKT